MWILVVVVAFMCGLYWFKVRADMIESDCEDLVEPGSREPYGRWVWTITGGE